MNKSGKILENFVLMSLISSILSYGFICKSLIKEIYSFNWCTAKTESTSLQTCSVTIEILSSCTMSLYLINITFIPKAVITKAKAIFE